MNSDRDFETAATEWLDAGSDATPPHVIDAVLLAVRSTPQERGVRIPWRTTPMTPYLRVAAVVVIAAIAGAAALSALGWGRNIGSGPSPDGSPGPSEQSSATQPPTLDANVIELLNDFLEARVAGEGAQQYLSEPEVEVPLLHATSSGAPYERAEFERVVGYEWPYEWIALKVRLVAAETVVEQLFFVGPESPPRLEYQWDGFGTDIAPTTEDGQPVAVPHTYFDGAVTLQAAHPWIFSDYGLYPFGRLIPEGPAVPPTTDGGQRNGWDELVLMADPALVRTDCETGEPPANAEALAESIRSDPGLEATDPVAMSAGGAEGLVLDVVIAPGAPVCTRIDGLGNPLPGVLYPVFGDSLTVVREGIGEGPATGEWMRLLLFDAPEGSSMEILFIAIVAPESTFERAVEEAAPVIDSLEFGP